MKRLFPPAALVVLMVPGCSCESAAARAMLKRPATRVAADWVLEPRERRNWACVELDIVQQTGTASGRQLPIRTTTWSVRPWLVLKGPFGSTRVQLPGGVGECWDEATLVKSADAAWEISWAADGRGVACREAGSSDWMWVFCKEGALFFCPHVKLGRPEDGPGWERFAADLMAPPAPGSLHPSGPTPAEWEQLAAFASGRGDFEPFVRAVLQGRTDLILGSLPKGDLARLQGIMGADIINLVGGPAPPDSRALRREALAVLRSPHAAGAVTASNAAQLLAMTHGEEYQEAMADLLLSEDWAPPATASRDPRWPRDVAWSLARCVHESVAEWNRNFSGRAESAMLEFLKRNAAGNDSQVPILFVLAMHGSAKAKEMVVATGKEFEGTDLPVWPASLDELWREAIEEGGASKFPPGAWAKAAPK